MSDNDFVFYLDIDFPENFSLGCLLGCVDLVDCIPQEEYLQFYPNGEVADPYVFVLANPQILPVKLPMNGKLKICMQKFKNKI